jgi:hypothetical protein
VESEGDTVRNEPQPMIAVVITQSRDAARAKVTGVGPRAVHPVW